MYYDDGETLPADSKYSATKITATVSNATQSLSLRRNPLPWNDQLPLYCGDRHGSLVDNIMIYGLGEVSQVWISTDP